MRLRTRIQDEKATKASSKSTLENKTSKGKKADGLRAEKSVKASSKATTESIANKGDTAEGAKENDVKNEKSTKAVAPDTVKNRDGKSLKNSKGRNPEAGGTTPGSAKPDGTVISINDAGTDDTINEDGKNGGLNPGGVFNNSTCTSATLPNITGL